MNLAGGLADPQFLENTVSLALVLLVLHLEQRVLSVLLKGVRSGEGVKIGSEHEEDVYEICGRVKEAGNSKKGSPFNL